MLKRFYLFLLVFTLTMSIAFAIFSAPISSVAQNIWRNSLVNRFFPDSETKLLDLKARDEWISSSIQNLTLREKIAQMFIIRAEGNSLAPSFDQVLRQYKPGGVILMEDNVSGDLKKYTSDLQKTNSQIPLFTSIDQEGGSVRRLKFDPNPGPQVLKNLPALICPTQSNTAQILKNNGINLNFGIVADIGFDKNSFIYPRTWGENPEIVSKNVIESLNCSKQILNTVKHFPGHGQTSKDSHKTVPIVEISESEWRSKDAIPFQKAIESGAKVVMISHLQYSKLDPNPTTLSKKNLDILRSFGLDGITVTDDMNMLTASNYDPVDALKRAILAGNDILLYVKLPIVFEKMIEIVEQMVKSGQISEQEINIRLERILRVKWQAH